MKRRKGDVETILAAQWCALLGLDQVGRHDSFFMLGRHSLLAVRLISHLQRQGYALSLQAVFAAPLLAEMAAACGAGHREVPVPPNVITPQVTALTPEMLPLATLTQAEIDSIVARVPGGIANIQDIYALSALQEGMLFHRLLDEDHDPYVLRLLLRFDTQAALTRYISTLQFSIDRHDSLRTAIFHEGLQEPVQVVLRTARLDVEQFRPDAEGEAVAVQLLQYAQGTPLRLERPRCCTWWLPTAIRVSVSGL
nr:hypothetical protein SYMBAF_320008 [Serratia symbiotica]